VVSRSFSLGAYGYSYDGDGVDLLVSGTGDELRLRGCIYQSVGSIFSKSVRVRGLESTVNRRGPPCYVEFLAHLLARRNDLIELSFAEAGIHGESDQRFALLSCRCAITRPENAAFFKDATHPYCFRFVSGY